MTPAPTFKPRRSVFDDAEEELRSPAGSTGGGSIFDEAAAELAAPVQPASPVPGMERLSPGGRPPAYPSAATPSTLPPPPPTPTEAIVRRPLRSIAAGALSAAAGTGHLIKSTADLVAKPLQPGQSPLAELPGAATLRKLPEALSQGGQQMQDYYGPMAESLRSQQPRDLQSKIYEGLGAAPIEIGKYVVGGAVAGGMTPGMAAIGAIEGAAQDEGTDSLYPKQALTGAAKGALMGKALHYISPATIPVRTAAMGGMFGAESAMSGGDTSDVVSSAVVGGGLGMMGGPGQRMADLRRDPMKPRMVVQGEPEVVPGPAEPAPAPTPNIPPRPAPRPTPPVPAPTGLDNLIRAQSQYGPAAETIPDRLLGTTPYQRDLLTKLGPSQAALLPSRLTEAQTVAGPKPGMPEVVPQPREVPGPVADRPVGPPVGSQAPGRMIPGRPVVRRPGESGMATPDALTGGLASRVTQESADPTRPFVPSEESARPGEEKEVILSAGVQPARPSSPPLGPLPAAIRDELSATRGWQDSAPAVIPQILDTLESRGYSRDAAGKELLAMADRGEISLATHDHGPALPEAERAKLLYDPLTKDSRGRDAYYVGASIRDGFPQGDTTTAAPDASNPRWGTPAPPSPGERGTVSIDPAVAATVDFLAKGVRTVADRAVAESKEFADIAHDLATNTAKGVKAAASFVAPRLRTPQPIQDILFQAKGERQRRAEAYSVTTRAFRQQLRELPEADQIAVVDRAMTGQPQPTPQLQAIADFAKDLTDEMYAEVKDVAPFATYRENYGVGIQWKVAPKHPDWDLQSTGQGSPLKSLQGSAGFLKHRFWGSLSKGMEYGGVPASTNLIDLLGMDYASVTRFTTARNIWKGLESAGQVQWVDGLRTKPPDGMIRLDVDVAKSYFTPEGKKTYNGGYWAISEGPGSMLKNLLSKDHWRNPSPEPGGATLMSLIGRGTMAVKNAYTMWELGFSFFHPMFVTAEAQLSYLGTAARRLVNLRTVPEAMTALKETLLAGTGVGAAAETAMIGRSAKQLFTEVAMAERGLSEAKSVDDVMALPQFKRMAERFPEAVEMVNDYFTGGGTLGLHADYDANFRTALTDALKQGRVAASLGNAVMALPEALSGPLFRHYIPALKLGTFMREYDLALKENSQRLESGATTRAELARKTVEFVEDRFGEMNFDNLFWNKTFKTSLQMGFRSVTWILGNTRSMATAIPQQIAYTAGRIKGDTTLPPLSPKGSWQMGMVVFNAVLGSLVNYAFTGEEPKDIKDLIYPRYDKSDPKARMVLPTSIKEAQAFLTHPLKRLRGGVSGIWGKTRDVVANQDYMGNQIRNPDDPIATQAKDVGGHLFPMPISVSSFRTARKSGGSDVEKFGSALGFLKAPRYITDDAATAAIREETQSRGINYTRTKQEAERAQAISGITRALAAGRDSAAKDLYQEALKAGTIREEDLDKVVDRLETGKDPNSELMHGIKALPLISVLNVWKVASPAQKAAMHDAMLDKFDSAMDTMSETQLKVLIRKMEKVGWDPREAPAGIGAGGAGGTTGAGGVGVGAGAGAAGVP